MPSVGQSHYQTFDQAGNVFQGQETIYSVINRVYRAGSWTRIALVLMSSQWVGDRPLYP